MCLPSKKRITIAIIILATYLIAIAIYYPSVSRTYNDIAKSPQSRTFQIPLYIGLSGVPELQNQSDIEIGLTLTYPYGTLVVDEPVGITAIVVLRNLGIKEVKEIDFTFQNWLDYPTIRDTLGVPMRATMGFPNPDDQYYLGNMTPSPNLSEVIQLNSTFYWSIEGDYKPVIELSSFDGTTQPLNVDAVVLHVYPQEQLTQIETNQASINLAVVVLIFSTVGIIALVVQILDHSEVQCKYTESHADNNQKTAQAKTKS
jgi:hypothetical protein